MIRPTDDDDEKAAAWHFHAARASAFEDAAGFVLEQARQIWGRAKSDDVAAALREVAQQLTTCGLNERQKQAEVAPNAK